MTVTGGASTEWVRRRNTALVLRELRQGGAGSRAELASRTGLAKATVGAIVADLTAGGVVSEDDSAPAPERPARGRPSRPVVLLGGSLVGLGLELNVDYVAAVLLDVSGDVLRHETRPVDGGDPVEVLSALVTEVVPPEAAPRLVGAVLAVPGLVGGDDRTVAWAPNLDVDGAGLAERIAALLGPDCPVRIANDADCAAYAEAHHGAATDTDSLLYLTGTVGIGAGIVSAGELVRGGTGFAGEVGHVPIGEPQAPCGCGRRGCWEASIGLHAMLRAVGLPELGTPVATAQAVAERAAVDADVRAGLDHLGHDVGLGLAVLAAVLDPSVVVLGGYFVPLGELVLDRARAVLDERLVDPLTRPELRVGALGIEAAALGAAERAFAPILAGEVELPV
ncbi:ROK family protein [Nocardioides flavescens]|uniref:ROK family protein n=1 Tax=Nocardioides flavescens TaxID=2691959 RepID=A0A6L7EQ29_9ACTN|nr:ROK family protein [Nocardioides flavescens]MXG89413.1 ROK family protein [Nocardioides flavescens]